MKLVAKNRSRRLRKKLYVDEFQELGFDVAWQFNEDTTSEQIDNFINDFFDEVIEPNNLGFAGEGDTLWHGLICTKELGKCTDEHRDIVEKWLLGRGAKSATVSELYDMWWG